MDNKKEAYNPDAIKKAAEIFGSLSKLAQVTGFTYRSVHKWWHGKAVPTPLSCMKIEKVTKGQVRKEDIRPNFDWENFELV
jgi:DNA-binding transcriptional regulator YdaS (Cro superfamily)